MNNITNSNTETEKLFQELHRCFLLIGELKDPIQIACHQKKLSILHAKWKDAVHAEIEDVFLPQLLPLFGSHAYQVILFDTGSILNISLAILLTGYSVEAYEIIREDLYNLIEGYSETHTCSISTLTVSYPLSDKHPLYEEISAGTIIWQRPDNS